MQLRRYGILMGFALLAGCTQMDEMVETISTDAVPIAFEAWEENGQRNGATRAANGQTGPITTQNYQLRHAGFGAFAATETGISPNLMYNQNVTFTVLADGSDNGYWSYYPLKYWPNDQTIIDQLYFCAYAPYVDTPADDFKDDPTNTGIVGMSSNDEATTPYIIYTRAKQLDETVDLLWSYLSPTSKPSVKGPVSLKMYHALARVAVALKLSAAPATDTKVLVRRITIIPTTLATSGKLNLTSHSTFTVDENEVVVPTWSNLTMLSGEVTKGDRTILIDHDPATTPESYCDISNDIRLIPGLPYSWQPEGLNETDYQNALTSESHQAYLYFIPQEAFTVTCTVAYTVFASDGTQTPGNKTMTTAAMLADPLRGNLTYHLNLTIEI